MAELVYAVRHTPVPAGCSSGAGGRLHCRRGGDGGAYCPAPGCDQLTAAGCPNYALPAPGKCYPGCFERLPSRYLLRAVAAAAALPVVVGAQPADVVYDELWLLLAAVDCA